VHDEVGVVKAIMVGADAVQLVSALLEKGPEYLGVVRSRLETWLSDHGYERANYLAILQTRRVSGPGSSERD
jgi:dihydroorotate dehydrogenase (fumarate)